MSQNDLQGLALQRQRLERGERLQGMHWLALGLSLLFTVVAWRYSTALIDERAETQFDRHAARVVELAEDKLGHYAIAIRSLSSFLASSQEVSLTEWQTYTDSMDLVENFPALRAFGVAYRVPAEQRETFSILQRRDYPDFQIRPESDRDPLLPIGLLWPQQFAERIMGLDMGREANRRGAIDRAFASSTSQLTGVVQLGVTGRSGLVLFDSFSSGNNAMPASTPQDGVAMAVILTEELWDGLGSNPGSSVAVRLSDQDGTIFEDGDYASVATGARLTRTARRTVHGRDWVFELSSTPEFDKSSIFWVPRTVLATGLLINGLILALFLALSRSNRQALNYAATAAEALEEERSALALRNLELSTANSALERFGYALSHDLRTPLNGIQALIEFATEDLAEIDLEPVDRENFAGHMQRAQRQVDRGQALIKGMLEYTGLGKAEEQLAEVDVRDMLGDIADGFRLDAQRLTLPDDLPSLQTSGTRLEQVFSNLIGNALKYHPTPDTARIEIQCSEQDGMVQFAVDDDGNGIEEQYRANVFDLFSKSHARSDIESSGVGLSIVQKSVEQVGGTVQVGESSTGGARFVFTWPRNMPKAA